MRAIVIRSEEDEAIIVDEKSQKAYKIYRCEDSSGFFLVLTDNVNFKEEDK